MAETVGFALKRRAINAGLWSVAGYGVGQIIRFASNLLFTHLLVPEVFGVMAIAYILMSGIAMFTDVGIKQNIVRRAEGMDSKFVNTAWSIQNIRGSLLWLIALAVSLIVYLANYLNLVPRDSVYANPVLPQIIAVVSLTAVMAGFESTKTSEASRNLAIGRITQIEIVSQIAGLLAMLILVSIHRSIWVLVAGAICSTTVAVVLSHVWLPGISNRWEWDKAALHEILSFGKWIFVSSIVGFLAISGDRLILGGLVDSTTLGIYSIAFLMFGSVEQLLSKVVGSIAFPAISQIVRDRPHHVKINYYKILTTLATFAYVSSGILIVSGQSIVELLYDHRYWPAGWMLQILAVGLVAIPSQIAAQYFLAIGRPDISFRVISARLLTLAALVPLGFLSFGVVGALWGVVASRFICVPVLMFYSVKAGLIDARKEFALLPLVVLGMCLGEILVLGISQWGRLH
jgi:O-antigen/teichoic acid export membrane protein